MTPWRSESSAALAALIERRLQGALAQAGEAPRAGSNALDVPVLRIDVPDHAALDEIAERIAARVLTRVVPESER